MKRIFSIAFIFLLSAFSFIYSKESVYIADLILDISFLDSSDDGIDKSKDNKYTVLLYDYLNSEIKDGNYTYLLCSIVGNAEFSNWMVRNESDASGVVNILKTNYLIYGKLKKSGEFFEAEMKIFGKNEGKNIQEFTHVSSAENKKNFLKETAYKLDYVIYGMIGSNRVKVDKEKLIDDLLKDKKEKEKKEKLKNYRFYENLGIFNSIGYTVPIGNWWNYFTGIINIETGIKIVNLNLYDNKKTFKFGLRPGFGLSYSFAVSKPELAESFLHTMLFKLPLDFTFTIFEKYLLYADIGIQLQLDMFYQNLYQQRINTSASPAFGWYVGTGFEYGINDMFSVGNIHLFDFASYTTFYVDYKTQIYLLIKFKRKKNITDEDKLKETVKTGV